MTVPNPLPAWFLPGARYRFGLLKTRPANLPKPPPKWAIDEYDKFEHWNAWQDAKKPLPRPKNIWPVGKVPHWAYVIRSEILAKRKPKPKPVPPPAVERVSIWKNPPWRDIGLHQTWGFHSGQFTPEQLADKIAGTRIAWSASEGSPDMENEKYFIPYRDALHARGKRWGIWERADAQKGYPGTYADHIIEWISKYKPDFYGADIEVPVQEPDLAKKIAEAHPNVPRIIIVAGMLDASEYTSWIANGWDCMTESYSANVGQPPVPGIAGAVDHDAFWRGFPRNFVPTPKGWGSLWWQHGSGPHTVPIIECNAEGNPGLKEQLESDAIKWFGGNYSIWSAEQLHDDDWLLLK